MMFGIEYNLVQQIPFYQTLPNGEVAATVRLQHLTLLFQTFVMMNLFNMFNCRKIGSETDPQLNVFDSIHHNWWFLIVLLVYLVLILPFFIGPEDELVLLVEVVKDVIEVRRV